MSQRSALSAAASATALVSEPPRPSVEMRSLGRDALEAGDHRDLALLQARAHLLAGDVVDARRAVRVVGDDRDLPALPGARLDAHRLQHDRQQPGGDLLAGGDHGVVFARVVQAAAGLAAPRRPAGWSCPAMAETTTATSWPASTSRLTWRATLRMRSMSATDVPPNFITSQGHEAASTQ